MITDILMEEFYFGLPTTLFYVAGVLLVFGLALTIMPERVMPLAHSLNRWVSTVHFFEVINRPRYQERYIYRYHRIFGGLFVVFAALSIYMLCFYTSADAILKGMERFADSAFYEWLFINLYYLILVLNVLVLGIGSVVFVRPSLLKQFEKWSNRWIHTDDKFETLDTVHEISVGDLTGRPRLFGVFVSLSALYMMFMVGDVIF